MGTVSIFFRPSSVPGREGTLHFRLHHPAGDYTCSSHLKLQRQEWDSHAQHAFAANAERKTYVRDVGRRIERQAALLETLLQEALAAGCDDPAAEAAAAFRRAGKRSFTSYLRFRIGQLEQYGKLGTASNYRRTANSLDRFTQRRDISFESLTPHFVAAYEKWLMQSGVRPNSVSFYMRILRAVYNRARTEGIVLPPHPFHTVYTGVERTRKRAVDEGVLRRLRELDLGHRKGLAFARDLFLLSFYCRGMAFADMAYLRRSDLRDGTLTYRRRKTGRRLSVRLERCMQEILSPYMRSGNEFLLPILSSNNPEEQFRQYRAALTRYNRNLSRLSRLLHLSARLTSYVARHSWATIARNRMIPLTLISEGMGHASESTTRIYLASLDQSLLDEANRKVIGRL